MPLAGKGRKVTLIATTKELQRLWCQANVAAIDGGYKFNIMNWPLHVIGVMNENQEFRITSLAITSTCAKPLVVEMAK